MRKRLFHADHEVVYPALLELFAHELLLATCLHLSYEPEIPGTRHRPEFVAADNNAPCLVAECKVVFDEEAVRWSDKELRRLVNRLKKFESVYGLSVQPHDRLTKQVSPRKIETFLRSEMAALGGTVPPGYRLVFEDADTGLSINFDLYEKQDPDIDTVFVWWPTGAVAQTVTTHDRIKMAVHEKQSRYGEPNMPYLILVWPKTWMITIKESIERALYGDSQWHLHPTEGVVAITRASNGVFTSLGPDGPIRTRVSAVGIYDLRFPHRHAHEHRFAIFHNPYAEHPLDAELFPNVPQFVPESDGGAGITIRWRDGLVGPWWNSQIGVRAADDP